MEEVQLGQYAVPLLITVFLAFIYNITDKIPTRVKPLLAVAIGVGLSLLAMAYAEKPWVFKVVVDYVLYGFMMGAAAVGIHQLVNKTIKPKVNLDTGKGMVCLVVGLSLMGLTSCVGFREWSVRVSEDHIQNVETAKKVIKNFLVTWPLYSGAINKALEDDMDELPQWLPGALNDLDGYAEKCALDPDTFIAECDLTDRQLGEATGVYIKIIGKGVIEIVRIVAPDLFSLLPLSLTSILGI